MKIFISWSESRSLIVAKKLREWLPYVLPDAEPWLSSDDIRKGSRWQSDVTDALERPYAGILVLTRDNLASRWLLFEAGAISKAVEDHSAKVCTYLVDDMENADVGLPLGMFQSTRATEDDTLALMRSLNANAPKPIPDERLATLFNRFWPDLEQAVKIARDAVVMASVKRDQSDILDEILQTVRGLARYAATSEAERGGTSEGRGSLLVVFNEDRNVSVDGVISGTTNIPITVPVGVHVIELESPKNYQPVAKVVKIRASHSPLNPFVVHFVSLQ